MNRSECNNNNKLPLVRLYVLIADYIAIVLGTLAPLLSTSKFTNLTSK